MVLNDKAIFLNSSFLILNFLNSYLLILNLKRIMMSLLRDYITGLVPLYGEREARAIMYAVLDVRFGMSRADVLCGAVERMTADGRAELDRIMCRLEQAEPLQYVLGETMFCGRRFKVRPGVLIPRPETEELCALITAENKDMTGLKVLDVGTGSGCIAVTLAADMPRSAVSAWDISPEALAVARENAALNGVSVTIKEQDILAVEPSAGAWDVIVSNPPYIRMKEREAMNRNVLDYEPHTALFVPDADPLLFYRAISRYAAVSLRPGGRLYFEVNEAFARETAQLMSSFGFKDVAIKTDVYGKERIVYGAL